VNKTAIVVISAHARFTSAMPILLLGWVFACYGPSAFYLAVVEQNLQEKAQKRQKEISRQDFWRATTPGQHFLKSPLI
jgi:hypothetical protein